MNEDTASNANGLTHLTRTDIEAILDRAAEKGARKALKEVGLEGPNAAEDIRNLRSLLNALVLMKDTALQTTVRLLTAGLLMALLAGLTIKLKLFGTG